MEKTKFKLPTKDDFLKIYKKSPIKGVDLFIYVMLILMAFVFLYPFMHMVINSFKSYSDIINATVKWIPKNFTLRSYEVAIASMRLEHTLPNSLIVTVLATIGHVVSCSYIAYGFARYKFPLSGVFFAIVILSILMPIQVIIIPMYITYSTFGVLGTYIPLIVPCFFGFGLKGGLFVFLYRQYFLGIPKSLEEAASIDGCGPLKTFFKIALPSAGSTTIVCIVLSLVWHWNDYYEPGLYLKEYNDMLLPQIVASLKTLIQSMQNQLMEGGGDSSSTEGNLFHSGVVMAGTCFSMIPPMIAYLFLQRKFMEGIERSGLTGM
ncbi:MAG: carbohydrate ABC transporter permease [Oscillospiraceae bacterium]|nr:carbohydrate ABC transporter permease [Oscillospiraceae bacterium]